MHNTTAMRTDRLSGDCVIYQPLQGQRYTTDDMLVAWLAVREIRAQAANADSFLELGCGLCAVSMIVLWCCPGLDGIGIEASPERLACARRSLDANRLGNRFQLINADLRSLRLKASFSFIVSSPPYYERGEGPLSPDPDRARVRFETRGSIEGYFMAAAAHATPDALFITVYPARFRQRAHAAARRSGFRVRRSVDIIPRTGKPPLFTLFACARGKNGPPCEAEKLTVRGQDRLFTPEFRAVRRMLGFPDKVT